MGILERIAEIEAEMAKTQKNKATNSHLGSLKAKLAKLRTELLTEGQTGGGGGGGEGFGVARSGDGRVALIGFPSVGKSTMLSQLTETESETNAVEFTTLTCIPGNLLYNDVRIQLLDLPGIIEGAAHGKGRGREVIAVAKSADMILMVLDAGREAGNRHREILENELTTVGLRLNRVPPDIYFRKKAGGGISFNSTIRLTQLGEDPYKTVYTILHEYRIHNAEVLFREDVGVDELIDVIEGNRKYIKCLYVYNKIDVISIEDVDALARKENSVVIACAHGDRPALNFDHLLATMWNYMGLTRIYTKRRGRAPDFIEPVVLSAERKGITVESACQSISTDMLENFNYAWVWGVSTKYDPQRVGKEHVLQDEDVLQIIPKTANQQKKDKNYVHKCQEAFDKYKQKKKKKALKT